MVWVYAVSGDRLNTLAHRQQQGFLVLPARRGMILDAQGRVAATSRRMADVFIDPTLIDRPEELAAKLGPRINVAPEWIVDRIRNARGSRYVVVAELVDEVTGEAVRALGHRAVGLSDRTVRTYPLGRSMAHVLGFVGREGRGLEGIELQFDEHLAGRDGRRVSVHDARRRALGLSAETPAPPIDGGHVVLTLEAEVQRITESVLERTVARFDAESGVAIVMDPERGDVLAMACAPMFNANRAAEAPADVRRNRAITDPTEPGSVFKPIIAAAALDAGLVSVDERIDCHNGIHYFGGRRVTDTSPQGLLDLTGILTHSSNIGMGIIAHRMGNPALHEAITRFGFGAASGVSFPGEAAGLVYPLEKWTSYSTNAVAIGYEVAVTPLQLVTAFAAIANEGVLIKPQLVRRLVSADGTVVSEVAGPAAVRRVMSRAAARFLIEEALVSAVQHGNARRAQAGPQLVAGKTGTAKLPFADRPGYEPGAYVGTFVGAAPADDPRVVVLVMIRRPDARKGYYGSTVAAPAAGEILAGSLAYLGVEAE